MKSKLGGYQTSNENYRKQVECYKKELLETKTQFKDYMRADEEIIRKQNGEISKLSDSLHECIEKEKGMKEKFEELKADYTKAKDELKRIKELPWYKRIFGV